MLRSSVRLPCPKLERLVHPWARLISSCQRRMQGENAANGAAGNTGTPEAAAAPAKPEVDKDAIIAKHEQDLKDLKDRYLRALAETENVRSRFQAEAEKMKIYGIQKFAKDVVEIADILEMAHVSVPDAARKTADKTLMTLVQGLESTQQIMTKNFEKHGLVAYHPLNEVFDPNLHEATFEIAAPEKKPGTVGHVLKRGYKLHGRVLRPAVVGVVKQ